MDFIGLYSDATDLFFLTPVWVNIMDFFLQRTSRRVAEFHISLTF